MNVPALVVLILGLVSTVFFVASASMDHWGSFLVSDGTGVNTGPFRASSGGTTHRYSGCTAGLISWGGADCQKWKTIQAFTIIGLVLAGVGTIIDGCASTLASRFPGGISAIMFLIAGCSGVIAMGIFAWFHENRMPSASYGPGFGLIIVAWVFAFFASYIACFGLGRKIAPGNNY